MKLVLVVIGDGRGELLEQTVPSISRHVLSPINARIMVDDSGDDEYAHYLDSHYHDFEIHHGGRRGMAGAVQTGFDAALQYDPDYVLWVEEDHMLLRDLPVKVACDVLYDHHELAQMTFSREPCDPSEGTDQLGAIIAQSTFYETRILYTVYDYLFSMIPCLIPRRIVELGWPSGPLGTGNEAGMTAKCLAAGYKFASWGHVGDPPFVRHIGYAQRTTGWTL